jgi:ribosomal protein L21E
MFLADLNAKERKAIPGEKFAVPGKRKLPIHDKNHIKLAWDMVDKTKDLSTAERAGARKKILAAAKKEGIDTSSWTKKEMTDTVISSVQVLTDATKENGPLKVRFKGSTANVVNENRRLYPLDVLTDAVERFKAKLPVVGESPHPKSVKSKAGNYVFDTKIENSVIKITDAFMDGNDAFFDAEILETAKGKDLKALIDQKVTVGDSIRMLGNSIERMIDNVMVDVTTYLDIHAWDIVMNPATDGCGVIQVLTDSQIEQIIEDGIQLSTPCCPHCAGELEPQSPDDDDDIDFYTCSTCKAAFVEDSYVTQTTNCNHTLSKVSPDNWDRYGLAREWLEQNGKSEKMTDSIKNIGGDEILKPEDLIKALKDNPELRAAFAGVAGEVAQPALDAVEAQKQAGVKAKQKAEAKVFLDEKIATLKEKFKPESIKIITDSIGEPDTKESVEALFDTAVKIVSAQGAKTMLDSIGFDGVVDGSGGHVSVKAGEAEKPWRPIVDSILKEMDEYGEQFGAIRDPKLRAYNKKVFEKVIAGVEEKIGVKALYDSVQDGKLKVMKDNVQGYELLSDSVSVTMSQLLNQPTILTAVIVQSFQDCESPQFMFTDVFKGSEWRLPIETFTSAAQYNPLTGLMDLAVAEGVGIAGSAINLGWQSFSPTWRRNAVSLSTDVIRQLETGPASYAAIARAAYHIGEDKKRKLDNAAYLEMIMASDEYAPLTVTGEVPASPGTSVSSAVPSGSNAAYLYKLAPSIVGAVAGYNPVCRPRSVNQIQPGGQVSAVVTNPVSITVGGSALVLGVWDGTNIQSFQGTTATAAIDFERGIVYFKSGAGLNPTAATPILPTISYSAVTNYDRWHTTMTTGYTDSAAYYDTFLQQLTASSALMGSSPRFKKPNLAIFSLNSATYVENARIFYKWASPDGTKLIDTGNTFGQRSNMNLSKINAPWVAGDGRVLLTQKGSTRYGIETPYNLEGHYPMYDANQNIIDAKLWYGRENSVMCTPQVRDNSFNIINPVSRTIVISS